MKRVICWIAIVLSVVLSGTMLFACKKREPEAVAGITIRFVTGFEEKGVIVDPITATEEMPAMLPEDPIYLGSVYVFDGWFYDEERTDEFDVTRFLTEDTVLYAKWRDNGSSAGQKTDEKDVDVYGVEYMLLADGTYAVVGYEGGDPATISDYYKGKKVTTLSSDALKNATEIVSIHLPATMTEIMPGAFSACEKLQNIYVKEGNEVYSDVGGVLYNAAKTELVAVGRARTAYTLPAKVTEIGKYAFGGCSFDITVGEGNVTSVGEYAFAGCKGNVTLGQKITGIRYRAFYEATGDVIFAPNCPLDKLWMGEFDGYRGKKITLPGSVTAVGGSPFYGCTAEIDMTATGIRTPGESAFAGYKGNTLCLPYFVESLSKNCFYRCAATVTFDERSNLSTICAYAFNQFCGDVTFPRTVTTVEAYAFYAMRQGKAHFATARNTLTIRENAFLNAYTANVTYGA